MRIAHYCVSSFSQFSRSHVHCTSCWHLQRYCWFASRPVALASISTIFVHVICVYPCTRLMTIFVHVFELVLMKFERFTGSRSRMCKNMHTTLISCGKFHFFIDLCQTSRMTDGRGGGQTFWRTLLSCCWVNPECCCNYWHFSLASENSACI